LADGVLSVATMDGPTGRVLRYGISDAALTRWIGEEIPAATDLAQPILQDVAQVRWRVLDGAGNWADGWPPNGPADATGIEIGLDLRLTGQPGEVPVAIERLIELPREPPS
jgi:hypothetical protein